MQYLYSGFVYLPWEELEMSKVKNFLENYDNLGTRRNLKVAIYKYFQSLYEEATLENLDVVAEKYFSTERDYERDLKIFLKSLNGSAPLTIKLKLSNIKNFLLENNVALTQKFWRQINRRIKGSRALTLDRIPTNSELKKILLHNPIQGKALYLTLESSGLRIGELLKSNIDDLYLTEEPARIQIRGEITKTGSSRHAFISREAKEALIEWLKVREDYLKAAIGKSHLYEKAADDPRIFPFNASTAYSMWKIALHKSGLNDRDKSTDREKLHLNVLRKFFRTRLGAAGITIDVVEALMGHEGYLTEVYRRYTLEDLRKFYLKGESALLVFTDAQEITKLRKEIREENEQIKSLFIKMSAENDSLKKRVDKLEKAIQEKVRNINEKIAKLQ
jgi:integrase